MRCKLYVGTLLAAAVFASGVAEAQGPTVIKGNVKKDGVKLFNVTFTDTGIINFEAFFNQKNIDADIYVIDTTEARVAANAEDTEGAIGIFTSTVTGYEAGTVSAVAGVTALICVVHETGPNANFSLVSSSKVGTDIEKGGVRLRPAFEISDGGGFDLYGSAPADLASLQSRLQRLVARKQ